MDAYSCGYIQEVLEQAQSSGLLNAKNDVRT